MSWELNPGTPGGSPVGYPFGQAAERLYFGIQAIAKGAPLLVSGLAGKGGREYLLFLSTAAVCRGGPSTSGKSTIMFL